ncbi:MAG: hypothetical protein J5I98_04835 [Phaeodactylibacter sp.]|nr:hypothetical protein [Phaeodactylibacter sp.]
MSFREYLKVSEGLEFPKFELEQLLQEHVELASEISREIRPLQYFPDYLKIGYYPFFLEGAEFYSDRLEQMIRLVIESDLDFIPGYDPRNAPVICGC